MNWIGKIVGALIGFTLMRSLWGAVVGAIIGHLFDEGSFSAEPSAAASISEAFFRTTFEFMGHVAKSDGRVSEAEIEAARRLMQELNLGPSDTARAIAFFRAGKAPGFDFERAVEQLRAACGGRHDVLRAFVELQVRASLAGNGLSPPARTILTRLAGRFGMSGMEFAYIEAALRARQQYRPGNSGAWGPAGGAAGSGGSRSSGGAGEGRPQSPRGRDLAAYYAELGVNATVSDPDIVKAYRRQMSRHHPDKLVANGLPESMAQVAKEKTQRIQEAYEEIRAARGMR